jgi:hypothetical protein
MGYLLRDMSPDRRVFIKNALGEKGIFVRRSTIRAMDGDASTALILEQFIFWGSSNKAQANDGWFYHTSQMITKETGLSLGVQRRVRKVLEEKELLESKRVGIPAKNYYRVDMDKVIDLLIQQMDEEFDNLDCSFEQSGVSVSANIVNQPVNVANATDKNTSYSSDSRRGANKSSHVLDSDRHQKAIEWVVENYPKNHLGIGATAPQAKAIIDKLGKLPKNYTSSDYWAADQKLNTLRLGIKNFKAAVDSGTYDRQFVFGFAKFAGLGVQYGDAPKYLAWAEVKPVQKKPTLEGVI